METCDKPHRSLHCTAIDKAERSGSTPPIQTRGSAKATTVGDGLTGR